VDVKVHLSHEEENERLNASKNNAVRRLLEL
jgi:hypothetical protein